MWDGASTSIFVPLSLLVFLTKQVLMTRLETVQNTTQLLDQLLGDYDKRLRPGFGGPPLTVDVNINIRSMGPVSEKDMAYQMDCYFRQSWVDERLKFTGPLKILPVSVTILDKLWKPDTHFFNGQRSYLHTITTPNKLLRINQDGRILYSMRLTIKASCPMHLEKFPMDTQICPLRVGSHGYDVGDMKYVWTYGHAKSIKWASDMTLSQFDLVKTPAGNDTLNYSRGAFSMLFVNFAFKRHMGYFMINVYAPCSLMVILSWVGFWINREATADRIALGITTVLTMAFLGLDNRTDLPKVSYSTALDYFVAMCFVFVLASIVQFAGVHYFTKVGSGEAMFLDEDHESDEEGEGIIEKNSNFDCDKNGSKKMTQTRENGETKVILAESSSDSLEKEERSCCLKFFDCIRGKRNLHYADLQRKNAIAVPGMNSVSKIDMTARIMFPVTFTIFHISYWSSYLAGNVQDELDKWT